MTNDRSINDPKQARAELTRIMVGRLAVARAMIQVKANKIISADITLQGQRRRR